MIEGWYVVQSRPQMEKLAADAVDRIGHGFRSIFPLVQFPQARPQPLFSRYFFTFVPDGSPWYLIRKAHGVSRILGGEDPHPVTSWLETLTSRMTGSVLLIGSTLDLLEFVPGDVVDIVRGHLTGMTGVCNWTTYGSVVVDVIIGSVSRRVRLDTSDVRLSGQGQEEDDEEGIAELRRALGVPAKRDIDGHRAPVLSSRPS